MTSDEQEWVYLITEAKSLGLTIEDIQHFLHLAIVNIQHKQDLEGMK
jgi:DNA-binding transcriptional MerR regulator